MAPLNKTKAGYFVGHKDIKDIFFCSDGLAYFTGNSAKGHAIALKKSGKSDAIEHYTREEVEAWWKEYAPQYAAECAEKLEAAEKELTAAQEALAKLPANTGIAKRAPYQKAVKDAQALVDSAAAELETATADAALVADKGQLQAAEDKLKADLSTANPDVAVIEADKAAVNNAASKMEADKRKKK